MSDIADTTNEWVCRVAPDKMVRLSDLTVEDMQEVVKTAERDWFSLYLAPLSDLTGAVALYAKCCQKAGVEPHELTVGELWNLFERVPDDRPLAYTGGLPDPKADEIATV